jgi:hypothetical protein
MATSCFPTAVGVPGNSTPPDWLSGTAAPFDGSPDDPRWVGALAHSLGDGTGVELLFRSLVDPGQTHLLLSWLVKVDPNIQAGADALFVGFGSAATAIVVRIQLTGPTPVPPGSPSAGAGGTYTPDIVLYSAMNWGAFAGSAPAWVGAGTRAWVNYGSPNPTPFAVHMQVPINQFLDTGNQVKIIPGTSFKMWYSAYINTAAEPGADVEYVWPEATGIGMTAPPAPNLWPDVRVSNIANDPACNQPGITIDVLDIGTKNIDGTARPAANQIRFDQNLADATHADHSNMFFAHPTFPGAYNNTRKGEVRARFRMANWGSQIGALTAQSWTNIPGGDDVHHDTVQAECHFIWPTQADMGQPDTIALLTNFKNLTTTHDQCILVELSSVHAGGEVFLRNSIRRNMWLAPASKFSRDAEISVVGLKPLSAAPRDVYLYLETINMPARATQDSEQRRKDFSGSINAINFAAQGRSTIEDLIKFLPTYRVHVYHDTGRRTTLLGGGTRRILSPQSSFGYFVEHEGELYGWETRLYGAEKIAENFYILRVPNNGSVRVTTAIQARESANETPLPPDAAPCGCLCTIWRAIKKLLGMG